MDNVTDAPKVAANSVKGKLAKVPKPVLVVGGVAIVGIVWYKRKHNTANIASTSSTNATPVADQGSTTQSYSPPDSGSISSPYSGYGNIGNYNTGLPVEPVTSGGSETTAQQLGDVSQLIGTLFPGGLPLGSGPVSNPLTGQGQSGQVYSAAPQAAPAPGVVSVGAPAAQAYAPSPAPPKVVLKVPAAKGTVTQHGVITRIAKEHGKTCHYYAGGKKECF